MAISDEGKSMLIELPGTHYVGTLEADIAYQVYGDGPVDLVAVGGPASHLEVAWENAEAARYLERLGSFARVVIGAGPASRTRSARRPRSRDRPTTWLPSWMPPVSSVPHSSGRGTLAGCARFSRRLAPSA